MKRTIPTIAFLLMLLMSADPVRAARDSLTFDKFGPVILYQPSGRPAQVVLFLSGDGGWNKGIVDMARELQRLNVLVIGIDITRFLRNIEAANDSCSYPASDLEALSKFVQKKLGLPVYLPPLLVGYSSGATLAYAVLVQAPPNTFVGAVSMGFCPDLPLRKTFCRGSGLAWEPGPRGKGYSFLPSRSLRSPWILLHGTIDRVCSFAQARSFAAVVPGAEFVALPKVGHGFAVERNWLPQFTAAVTRLRDRRQGKFEQQYERTLDLPVVEVPAVGTGSDLFAVILSGDGGWAGLDREIGEDLARRGIPVAGLNSLQYFWTARTPEGMAADVTRMVRYYLDRWNKRQVILIGYSFGADVLPFAISRIPDDLRVRVQLVVLIGPSEYANFEFHVGEWLTGGRLNSSRPVRPEVERLHGCNVLCLFGKEEKRSLCEHLVPGTARTIELKGGHHFGGNYTAISEKILEALP